MISRWKIYLLLAFVLAAIYVWNAGGQLREFTNPGVTTLFPGHVQASNAVFTLGSPAAGKYYKSVDTSGLGVWDWPTNLTIGPVGWEDSVVFLNAAGTTLASSGLRWHESGRWLRVNNIGDASVPVTNIYAQAVNTIGSESGLLGALNSNGVGAAIFTHNGPSSASNVFNFAGVTNPVVGQVLRVHSVSGNVVTITNDFAPTNSATSIVGAGTEYTLSTVNARVDFGTTDVELSLEAGTWLITVNVRYAGDAAGVGDYISCQMTNITSGGVLGNYADLITPVNNYFGQFVLRGLVTFSGTTTIGINGRNNTSARGAFTSTQTDMVAVRIY